MQANRLCAEMFGYTLDEFVGQPALILYADQEGYSVLGREAGPVLSRGESFRAETQLKRKDGSRLWCRVSAKAVDPEQPRDGTLWIIEDIAENNPTEAAANLFHFLRQADHLAQGRPITVAPIPDQGLGHAINDRLRRAAAPRP